MYTTIEEIYDTYQQSIELFSDELDDISDSISVFRESLNEFSDELSELYETFDSICVDAEDEEISITKVLAVFRFVEKLRGFENLLPKGKKKNHKPDHAKSMDSYRHTEHYCKASSEDGEIPFV